MRLESRGADADLVSERQLGRSRQRLDKRCVVSIDGNREDV
jgi:hypothetical protein